MAFPDDLLKLAQDLADLQPPNQASLRRAVSTAYYAIFHLLVSAAAANWSRPELRATLGRLFDHGPMKQASTYHRDLSNSVLAGNPTEAEKALFRHLRTVADTFVQAQQRRHEADYNTAKEWTPHEVYTQIDSVKAAFEAWNTIRDQNVAQEYLLSLLGKERRPSEPVPRNRPKKRDR
jgi:uncharacterized protein (UPF0332 family)